MRNFIIFIKWIFVRAWYMKRAFFIFRDRLLYTKSSRIFYKRAAQRDYEIEHTRFYNFLGRTLFALKELTALITDDKIFKKSIILEGYENYDPKRLYKEGNDRLLWPLSPFVELKKSVVSEDFFKKIENSYKYSVKNDPYLTMNKEKVWEKHLKEFKEFYFDKNDNLIKERIINFRKEKGSGANILTDHFEVINSEYGYFKSYLKSLDLILDFHRFSNFIEPSILQSVSDSYAGEPNLPVYRGQRLSDRIIFLATVISEIKKHLFFDDSKRTCIVDIGGGFGHMGRFTHYYIQNSCYILVELSEMSVFGAYFLKYAFNDKKVATIADILDRTDDFESLINEYDFIILPAWAISKLPNEFVDLHIATGSIAEMPEHFAQMYLNEIDRTLKFGGYFYTNSRVEIEKDKPYLYIFYKWKLKSRFLTLSYNYHPVNLIQKTSPQWIGKKVK